MQRYRGVRGILFRSTGLWLQYCCREQGKEFHLRFLAKQPLVRVASAVEKLSMYVFLS